ncbi:dihydrofolate reductase [Aromatoleum aromaticum]|uniref:Dihydrofolate reductase n=1 Tax=Aromatoleum aromaticum (strain DSM 19018 / LMG 30748 / EbN1) TaxID=76114 RepID=Q5P234_AROAE|nr:dihydrofolate reductase [Aromatoleum aromaticum]NMG54716.1 diacylglycerol kinase [Aromatoleum aromaticum]CAI08630.1 Dihydrofolate reductase [Aromatoleum aromaticum EbN1]
MSASKPQVIIIAATARNGAIGRDNQLPWRLKSDLARFKETTIGHPVLMGRKTWESLGRPLPARRNLVVTRDRSYSATGAEVFPDPEAALEAAGDETVFVIGGAELYRQLLDSADALLLTEVHADVAGDAYFPPFDRGDFDEVRREQHDADAHNEFSFDFVEYRRKTR